MRMRFIWNDDLAFLTEGKQTTIERASHVEPDEMGKWWADLSPVGGPKLGPYPLRQSAIEAEIDYLRTEVLTLSR